MRTLPRFRAATILAILGLAATPPAVGQAADKDQFSFSTPTPRSMLRPLASDRPSVTASPYSVDAGQVQLELSFFEFVNDGENETIRIAPLNLKVGLTNSLDVQLLFQPYIDMEFDDDRRGTDGIGDTELRAKWNLWGNDGGATALAIMPYLRFPTSSDDLGTDEFEGGVIVPFHAQLNREWALRLSGDLGFVHDDEKDDYDTEFLHTLAVYYSFDPETRAYAEYVGVVSGAGGSQYEVSAGGGLRYLLNNDWSLDLGTLIGLDGGAEDFTIRTGMTLRF